MNFLPINKYLLIEKVEEKEPATNSFNIDKLISGTTDKKTIDRSSPFTLVKLIKGFGDWTFYIGKNLLVQTQGIEEAKVNNEIFYFISQSFVVAIEEDN